MNFNSLEIIVRIRNQNIYEINSIEEIKSLRSTLDVELNNVDHNNVSKVTDFREKKYVDTFLKFLKKGDLGVYAFVKGNVVGHAWVVMNFGTRNKKVNGYMNINPHEAFIHFCNVSEHYRGINIYPLMISKLCEQLFLEKKIGKIIIDTDTSNTASINGIKKVGFKFLYKRTFIQLFNTFTLKW